MNNEFEGLVAVVTGAAQGIGLAIAAELHQRGARLLLVDRNAEAVAAAAQSIQAEFAVADLASPAQIEALGATTAALVSKVDALINNAGIELDLPFEQITAEAFDRVIAVNLRAPLLLARALAPLFPPSGGAIVHISSIRPCLPRCHSIRLLQGRHGRPHPQPGTGTGAPPHPRQRHLPWIY